MIENTLDAFKSGFVGLVGRPNVGKSSLVNQLVGKTIAITSPIAQTTRNRLRAILTTKECQLVLVDTPGIHKPHHLLGQRLIKSSYKAIGEVDCILFILDGSTKPGRGDEYILKILKERNLPVIVVLNKWDLVSTIKSDERLKEYKTFINNKKWIINCCSSINGEGCDELINTISTSYLPEGDMLYPSNMITDQPERILLAELIREQVLNHTREEIPHSVAVKIDRIEEVLPTSPKVGKSSRTAILATVMVEKKSQKGILIGKKGIMLRRIGEGARMKIQILINGPVYLELFVKVEPNWRSKPSKLSELGYLGD